MTDFLERISQLSPKRLALLALDLQEKVEALEAAARSVSEPIAVVGLSCRYPGGVEDSASYWRLLHDGVDAIQEIDASRWNVDDLFDPDPDKPGKVATRWGGFLQAVDQFDPQLFGISPREAMSMDPQQRLALEAAWSALEHAGYAPDQLGGRAVGVFMGSCNADYTQLIISNDRDGMDMYTSTGNAHSVISGRIAYVLGLQGPAVSIDTACSSSLVAVHLAVQSLRMGECQMALAGGVNLILTPDTTIALSRAKMMASDGRCKAFDAAADGFVRSEGCGMVVLKRLTDAQQDGDHILAVIRGSAANQDGRSNGLTAPNGPSQVAVIRQALVNAEVQPRQIGYVETHGTGTSLGDPIEAQALGAALGQNRSTPLAIGSVKTNIGHAEAAAGVAGLIKVVLSLQHQEIPPHLHLQQLSPHIPWSELPLTIPTVPTPWLPINGRRLAGVSSFGFSGTNAHIILEEAPAACFAPIEPVTPERPLHVLTLSGKTDQAVRELAARYAQYLADTPADFASICYTANNGRAHLPQRVCLTMQNADEARAMLTEIAAGRSAANAASGQAPANRRPEIVFMFTGQGAQYLEMGKQLYETQPTFRRIVDRCDELLRPYGQRSLIEILYPQSEAAQAIDINDIGVAQPALFVIEYALAELWRSWGVIPSAVVGHSIGEYVAATLAGVFSLEDGLKLIATRARLMASLPPTGEMAAVFASEAQVLDVIAPYADRVSIAAVNWPESVVISGERSAVQAIIETLKAKGIRSRQLAVSIAAHSPLMEPLLDEFERVAATVTYAPPQIDLVSGMTGQIVSQHEVTNAAYWRRHMRQPVRFAASIETLRQHGYELFVEVGPAPTLIGMAQRCVSDGVWLPSLRPGQTDWQTMLNSLGALYVRGVEIDWTGFEGDYATARRRVPLPTYPFQRQRYWFSQKPAVQAAAAGRPAFAQAGGHPLLGARVDSPVINDVVFETHLNAQWPAFLDHHRIYGLVVLPSPAYLEMALTAAKQAFGAAQPVVEEFTISEALLLPEEGARTIQLIMSQPHDDRVTFQVFSRNAESWTLHATGKVQLKSKALPHATLSRADVKARCDTEISGEDYYAMVRDLGLEFGAKFQGIKQLWRRDGEALGLIELPIDLAAEAGEYHIHPALLDACFHVLGAPLPQGADLATFLLIGLDRFVLHRAPGAHLWNHTVLRSAGDTIGETFAGDIQLFDDEGRLVAEAQGLHLKRATPEALRRVVRKSQADDWLYEVHWQAKPLSINSATPQQIADRVRPDLAALSAQHELGLYREMLPALAALTTDYIHLALRQLGWQPQLGERFSSEMIGSQLGVVAAHQRLLTRWLTLLAEDGVLRHEGDQWLVVAPFAASDPQQRWEEIAARYPQVRSELALIQRCGPRLARVLSGEVNPVDLLFPDGSLALTEPLYNEAPYAQAYNALVQQTVVAALADRVGRVRVLEIGAGSGATTAQLLPVLPPDRTEYTFTDLSPLFLSKAAERFRDFGFVRYQLLDIEREAQTQGLGGEQFDLIVAANVLHATKDLRETLRHVQQLLAPGGLLILLEGTEPQRWVDITFGLTDGWWRFHDTDLRPEYPLLSQPQWVAVLSSAGFSAATALALPMSDEEVIGQAVILARAPIASGDWLIVGDGAEVPQQVGELLQAQGHAVQVCRADDYAQHLSNSRYQGVIDVSSLGSTGSAAELCEQVLGLTQALLRTPQAPKLWVVTRSVQAVENDDQLTPGAATLWGLGRVIAVEHPEVWGGLIDLPMNASAAEDAALILAAVLSGDGEDQSAWRNRQRLVPRLVRKPHEAVPNWQAASAGTYLITGGLGGLGLKVAAWLVDRGARHLVLMGRSGLAGAEADRKGAAIKALEAAGAIVTVIAGDVADRAVMSGLFDRLGRDLPALRGVFHTAAALSAYPVEDLPFHALRDMLRPKVDGTWLLHELTRDLKLDCFVMFSSTTALWGARALAHYAAANAYLDALAHYRRQLNLPALSINWGTWEEMRVASQDDRQSFAQFGLQPMPNDRALAVLGDLLSRSDVAQIAVAAVDWRTLKAAYEAKRPRPFLAQIETLSQPRGARSVAARPAQDERPLLQQRMAQVAAHERREVAAEFVRAEAAKVLGVAAGQRIDDQQGLFEMGMDSLMSVELKSHLEAGVGHALPSTLTFNYPSIAALTDYLLADALAALPPPAPISAATPVVSESIGAADEDDLSEDDLAALLAAKLSKLG
jgi:acyl transferase domain-containing protein